MGSDWRNVPGFPSYEVSNTGVVRRSEPVRNSRVGKVMKHSFDRNGYITVSLRKGGRSHRLFVHRLVALAFLGTPKGTRMHVAHWDGVKTNNNLANLRWASPKENCRDSKRLGTARAGLPKLTPFDVDQIRKARSRNAPYAVIASLYGVSEEHVRRIVNRRVWVSV